MFVSPSAVGPSVWNKSVAAGQKFREIWNVTIFFKSVDKNQVSFKSDKNNGNFTGRPIYIFDHISINTYWIKNVSVKR
jgi:hypothetical protein